MHFLNSDKLEFELILEKLKNIIKTSKGKIIAEKMDFSISKEDVEGRLEEVRQAKELYLEHDEFELNEIFDIDEIITDISKGRFIHFPMEYKKVARTLKEASRLGNYISKLPEKYELLKKYGFGIYDFREIVELIDRKIDDEGEIKENASATLKHLIHSEKGLRNRIEKNIKSLLSKYSSEGYLQENFYTVKNDRYVFPIKSSAMRKIKGIVQGGSGSGNTVFIEPLSVVEMNNELAELYIRIDEEKRKILFDLGKSIASEIKDIMNTLENISYLDFLIAKAKLAVYMDAYKPNLYDEGVIEIYGGRHPLLEQKSVVPIDIWVKDGKKGLVITGPNAGGKSVSLKTIGLFTLMTMYGLLIPAQSHSNISIFENIFVDIGDFQSIEENLSTFSGHMKNLIFFVNNVTDKSLVLLDEVGIGTDPEEGAALAMSLIDYFIEKNAIVITTTHYNALKRHSMEDERLENAAALFDYDKIAPLFKIKMGVPGSSNGLLVAKRLGMNDEIIEKAKSVMDKDELKLEETILKLEQELSKTEKLREKLERENETLQKKMRYYEEELKKITKKRDKKKMESLIDFEKEFYDLKDELKTVLEQFNKRKISKGKLIKESNKLKKAIAKVHREKEEVKSRMEKIKAPKIGDFVFLELYGFKGEIIAYNEKKKEYTIDANGMKVVMKADEMVGKRIENKKENKDKVFINFTENSKFTGSELVLVGMRVEDALPKIDDFISHAILKGYDSIKIVHGIGSGKLKNAIHEYLKNNRIVKDFYLDSSRGVATVVILK